MLSKSVGSPIAEVVEVLSDTELRIKKEFSSTSRIREKEGGLEFKAMPHVDQGEMYKTVYKELREGGCLGIFPEGNCT